MKKGFTLIELLVVIAILAVLSTAVVLVLNPAELIKQSRDTTRISDLGSIQSAIALYLADVTSPSFTVTTTCQAAATSPFLVGGTAAVNASTSVTGGGWVSINLSSISSGSPLARLPLDPVNSTTYTYCYAGTSTLVYEINAKMESTKYASTSVTDGGNNTGWYEVGNSLTM